MITLLLAACCSTPLAALSGARPADPGFVAAAERPGDEALKALDAWLKLYRKDKIDFRSNRNIAKDSVAAKFGLVSPNRIGTLTWAADLEAILDHVRRRNDPAAALALAEIAAIGLDQGKYSYAMAPYDVRRTGERFLAFLDSNAAKQELARGAAGEWTGDRSRAEAMRAAALRGLGLVADSTFRPAIEAGLVAPSELVRIHAAEGLSLLGDQQAANALVDLIDRETSDPVLIAAAQALRSLYKRHLTKAESADASKAAAPPTAAAAQRVAAKALGRASWRADLALIDLLDDHRTAASVPALIGVLERFRDHPDDVKSGKLSGLLRHRVHELLVNMTGAFHPADQPERWRELWEREQDNLQIRGQAEQAAASAAARTTAAGFAGMPVLGTRVVFVLDLSGSMEWPMEEDDASGNKRRLVRLDYAKRELCRAVDALAPDAMFNLVTFNGNPRAEKWSKDLVPATEKNRERFKKHVEKLRALGGTNLWSGLEEALKIRSLVYGNRYETSVDEVFVLSDGAPTVGDVTDPIEILRLVEECNRFAKVRINTVFISSATPPEAMQAEPQMSITPSELMRRMAQQNGGMFRDV